MFAFLLPLVVKFPFIGKVGKFLGSGKFLKFIVFLIVALFIATQTISFVKGYVDNQVTTRTEIAGKKLEIDQLKNQVKTMQTNQKVIEKVVTETKVIQIEQQLKADKIEDKIDEQVQNGFDGYTGRIVTAVIDSM